MRAAVPRLTAPPYPLTAKAIDYAEHYRVNYFIKTGDPKGFHVYQHNRYIDITATGGDRNYFVIYAYPPGGLWFAGIDELELAEDWRGWILLYDPPTQSYKVIACSKDGGHRAFDIAKQRLEL